MTTLVRVELGRLRQRRAVVLLLVATVALPLLVAWLVLTSYSPTPAGERAQAQRQADRSVAACLTEPEAYLDAAEVDPDEVDERCREQRGDARNYIDSDDLDLERQQDESGLALAAVVGLLALMVGTTYVGHDWNTGSMSNQLLFEPRRLRVWSAKALAVTLTVGVVAAIGASVFWLVLAAAFWTDGQSVPDGQLLGGLAQGARVAGVAALGALGGYALTMLTRSTVATLGLLFGVSVAGGILIGLLVDDRGWVDPTLNVLAVVENGTTYDVEEPCPRGEQYDDFGGDYDAYPCSRSVDRSAAQGVTYLVLLLGAVSAASAGSYRRRDVP